MARKSPLRVEHLEDRLAPAVDLAGYAVNAPATAVIGSTVNVFTDVDNLGTTASGSFTVQYRLSTNNVISTADPLLKTVTRPGIAGGTFQQWTESVSVPAGTAFGRYYIGVLLDPNNAVAESNEANNAKADADTVQLLTTRLSGTAAYNGAAKPVSIQPYNGVGAIDPAKNTWLVVHGRNNSPASGNIAALAAAIDGQRPDATDQVLTIDWSQAADSGLIGGSGENYIKPVASWVSATLSAYGFTTAKLNFVGHSWGSYVSAETSELFPGGVNTTVALDPATNYPFGSYDPEAAGEVNFSANTRYSWAFFESWGDPFGSSQNASEADESFVVLGSDHSKLVSAFANLLTRSSTSFVASLFRLDRLLSNAVSSEFALNRYNDNGYLDAGKPYDGVFWATDAGTAFQSMAYVKKSTGSEVAYFV